MSANPQSTDAAPGVVSYSLSAHGDSRSTRYIVDRLLGPHGPLPVFFDVVVVEIEANHVWFVVLCPGSAGLPSYVHGGGEGLSHAEVIADAVQTYVARYRSLLR